MERKDEKKEDKDGLRLKISQAEGTAGRGGVGRTLTYQLCVWFFISVCLCLWEKT